MKIDLSQLKKLSDLEKLESPSPSQLSAAESAAESGPESAVEPVAPGEAAPPTEVEEPQMVAVIVQVNEPNYVPPDLEVRAQIDPMLFTANVPLSSLMALEEDPKVQSFSLGRDISLE